MGVTCECGVEHSDWVPKDRLAKVAQQRKDAEAAAADLQAKVADLSSQLEASAALSDQVAKLTADRDRLTARAAIMQAGITDPEGIEVVEALWAARPEDARPPDGLTGWLTSPDELPRAVRAYLPSAAPAPAADPAPADAPTEPAAAPAATAAPTNGHRPAGIQGVRSSQPASSGRMTDEQIRSLSPAEYRAWRDGGGVTAHKGVR
jgi:hypothetical protein